MRPIVLLLLAFSTHLMQSRLLDEITELPGLHFNISQFAGYVPVEDDGSSKDGSLFYWLFTNAKKKDNVPLIVWLNGGPGCSSMDGLFLENGPFKLTKNGTLQRNKYSWHELTNIVFLDQPIGTGLSNVGTSSYRTDNGQIGRDFSNFITRFFEKYPQLKVHGTAEIYIFGESYAGRYIPAIVSKLLQLKNNVVVKGVGIGNGWVDPIEQYDYSEYAYGMGFINEGQKLELQEGFTACRNMLLKKKYHSQKCFSNMNQVLDSATYRGGESLNYYNVREYVANIDQDYPPGRKTIEAYLNRKDVKNALRIAPGIFYQECSDNVYNRLSNLDGLSALPEVNEMLQASIPVLMYSGQWDMMCNFMGTAKFIEKLDWPRKAQYQKSPRYVWKANGLHYPGGYAQQGGGLSFVIVADSGHMVPMDNPIAAYSLVDHFIHNRSFSDSPQSIKVHPVHHPIHIDDAIHDNTGNSPYLPTSSWLWICFFAALSAALLASIATACYMKKLKSVAFKLINENDDSDTENTLEHAEVAQHHNDVESC